jgi:hypothetical protein
LRQDDSTGAIDLGGRGIAARIGKFAMVNPALTIASIDIIEPPPPAQ